MSQENVEVEIVRAMYEAFRRGDADGTLTYFDTGVMVDASVRVDGGIGRGHEDLTAIIAKWIGTFDDWREEIEEMRGLGNRVLVISTQRGRGKGSGIEIETRYAVLYEIEGGKITRLTLYLSPAEALEAAGLRA
jgi:ketosteroid isomerase-like protein